MMYELHVFNIMGFILLKNKKIMEYSNCFLDLLEDSRWKKEYIGLGNPNAKILIVGKECALKENNPLYERTFKKNWEDWSFNAHNSIGYESISEWNRNEEILEKYNPLLPFYKQKFKRLRKLEDVSYNGGTSPTWWNYQKLINLYRKENGLEENLEYIDFFKECFITELSSICRPNNNKLSKEDRENTRESIARRYDLIKVTPYFKNFDTVIMVCGGYADKLDTKLMFGNANIINKDKNGKKLPQLSYAISNVLLENIASFIK